MSFKMICVKFKEFKIPGLFKQKEILSNFQKRIGNGKSLKRYQGREMLFYKLSSEIYCGFNKNLDIIKTACVMNNSFSVHSFNQHYRPIPQYACTYLRKPF